MEYQQYNLTGFLTTSNKEIIDISKAWLAISIAFGLVLGGITITFFRSFIISMITVGLGFLLHELSHKVVAQYYHYKAEFRSFDQMLFLAIIMGFFGFVLAAPGAVMIQANENNIKKSGHISMAGPLMNIILASIFFVLSLFIHHGGIIKDIISYGFLINSWLALFNMIPFSLFDGAKIFKWNKIIWGLFTVMCVMFVFIL